MKNNVTNKNLHTNNVITCDNLTISLGSKKNRSILIDKFNFAFEKNKIYAIVGGSGVGKTTLVSHFNGLLKSNDGNIFIDKDKSILGEQRKIKNYKAIRKDVSLVFQFPEYQIFKDTVEKDIAFGPINYSVNKQEAKNLASKYMYLVGLNESLASVNPFDLSNGQKRLVAIAGVLAIESQVVIFDEPTAGLDSRAQKNIINIIKQLKKQGKTIILITHNMDNVLELADEVLVLHDQRLHYYGTPYEIFTDSLVLKQAGLATPHVILMINKLINHNNKYEKLLEAQPRTLEELTNLLKKGGK
ncbi:MAG: ATP-binding cassette domain-containing protein [Mycoplasmoidaceae bacterium]|nr:ATP-binding cassette domain-containing protein [Mycoplasmoidaceae bacterium]